MTNKRLSPSKLSVFKDCPRCFWLAQNLNIARPRGIFPSLPGGMDLLLKTYCDGLRKSGNPPGFPGLPEDLQFFGDLTALEKMRNWRTGLSCEVDGFMIRGALDDLLMTEGGLVVVTDFKTKGSKPGPDYATRYYQNQMNLYGLMLHQNGYKVSKKGYILCFYPKSIHQDPSDDAYFTLFNCETLELDIDLNGAVTFVKKAIECLSGPIPDGSCEYCDYVNKSIALTNTAKATK